MDYEDYILMREAQNLGEGNGEEEECVICKAAPCRCDAIYDAWKEEGIITT